MPAVRSIIHFRFLPFFPSFRSGRATSASRPQVQPRIRTDYLTELNPPPQRSTVDRLVDGGADAKLVQVAGLV